METTENNKSNDCVSHSSYMAICNTLYNNMKHDNQISNSILGLLLKLKDAIHSKNIIIENLAKRIDNYHNLFTNLKEKSLKEPSKITHKELKKRINVYL